MTDKPNVWSISATCGRHETLERLVACFMAQDYDGPHTLLIYNNSEVSQGLDYKGTSLEPANRITTFFPEQNKTIYLISNHIDYLTRQPYTNLGAIYRDALTSVFDDAELITHMDDDDIFLPNHISEGVKGFLRAKEAKRYVNNEVVGGYEAYKPEQSWFRHANGIEKMGNNLEPSIFVDVNYIRKYGYKQTTTDQHFGWFGPLLENNELYIDKTGPSTLIYNWGDMNIPTFKTSGNSGNPDNFMNYRIFSQDHGDKVITPLSRAKLEEYYSQVYDKEHSIV